MEDKQFDEALVEKVAKALHAMGFIIPAPDSAEVTDSWDESPPSYKDMHHIQAKYVLSSLSSTHAIVPKEEYEQICGSLKAAVAVLQSERFCPPQLPNKRCGGDGQWGDPPAEYCEECLMEFLAVLAKEASPHA